MAIGLGDKAPPFSLPASGATMVSLADFLGSAVVLAFYPADNSPVCTRQLSSYSDGIAGFEGMGATVLGISPQDVTSHDAFTAKLGLTFPLLSDVDKVVGSAYGVLGPLGFYRRSAFVVDGEGVIRYAHRATAGLTYRSKEELVAAVEAAR